jgi:ABC-2 type transport system permease protein
MNVLGLGARRSWIELRLTLTNAGEMLGWLWFPVMAVVVMYVLRENTVPGTDFSLGAQAIPGILGMNVLMTGLVGLAMALVTDRADGTLLRAKATPNGMVGYLIGRVLSQAGMTVATLLIVLIPAAFLFDGLAPNWVVLVFVLVLGLVATLPIGAVLGSLFANPQNLGLVMLLVMVLVGISGVFYPVTALPEWLQWVAQVFPLYWLGLGMRWALLPDTLAVVELGESWRVLEMIGVLGAWTVVGFVLAPIVLRRTARQATGSRTPS